MKNYLVDIYLAKNLGDDMFLKHLAESLPNANFVPYYPGKSYNKFFNSLPNIKKFEYSLFDKILSRLKIKSKLRNYTKLALQFDGLIFLGGGIFREETYWPELFEYRQKITHAFKEEHKKVFFLSCNFGPYKTNDFLIKHKGLFSQVDDVCFRDFESFQMFNDLKNVRTTSDFLWSYKLPKINKIQYKIGISVINPSQKPDLIEFYDSYLKFHITLIEKYINKGFEIMLFSFCDIEGDLKIAQKILESVGSEKVSIHDYNLNINKTLKEIGSCSFFVASRFHASIIALKYKIPIFPIIYNIKTLNLLNDINFEGKYSKVEDLKTAEVDFVCLDEIKINKLFDSSKLTINKIH